VSRLGRSNLRDAATGALWAITEEKLFAVLDFLDERAAGHTLSKTELRASGIKHTAAAPFTVGAPQGGQIAVLPLRGVIAHHAGMEMDISGGTSTVAFGNAFDRAMADASVSAIVIDADSPGGAVEGVPELFGKIFASRGTKPITAVCNAHMHSAAYWICAAADEIVITPSGCIGDIGVMTVRPDTSAADAKAGIKRTLIKAGKHKGEGAPFAPMEQDELDARQAMVEQMYAMFTGDVAKGRRDSVANIQAGYGEGRSVLARDAVAAGLADRIATFQQVVAQLGGQAPAKNARRNVNALRAELKPEEYMGDPQGQEDADEVKECPDCGHEMELKDGEYVCPECDETPASDPLNEAQTAAMHALSGGIVAAASRTAIDDRATLDAAATLIPLSTQAAPTARPGVSESALLAGPLTPTPPLTPIQEQIMTEQEKEAALKALREAETERVTAIRALAADHGLSLKADAWISEGKSLDGVRAAILEEKKTMAAVNRGNLTISGVHDRGADQPFATLGQQLQAIANAGMGLADSTTIGRLHAAVSTGGASATVGSDGAFGIQKEFATELLQSTIEGGDILGQTDSHEVGANADGLEVMYLDETSRATGSRWGGVQVYRGAEADSATAKKPKFGKWECRLEDIIGSAYMTERLLQDAASIQAVFETGFMEEFRFTAENEMVRGTGAGQMLGILNSDALVTVAKETGQPADTIQYENIAKMWKSVHPRARMAGAWYYNQELEDQFDSLQIGTGATATLVYMPPGGISGAKYGTIKGRPAIPLEYASGKGDVGDIFFAAWNRYKVITKGGLQSADSIHVRFLNNERTFRWITRINGAPKDKSTITPFKATDSTFRLGNFVTLAAR
jgi:HK97 family phage major capsid protein